jgi:hypothetical protein
MCAQDSPESRPTMQEVVEMLKSADQDLRILHTGSGLWQRLEAVTHDENLLAAHKNYPSPGLENFMSLRQQ